ncbi:hypothetical protein [Streptomyces sp. NPDC047043]|uniref:hypothetical protein n=1 Tax=Streptomyces sp. NPDC047043 TaxID=3154497 RepID=UPI0033CA4801
MAASAARITAVDTRGIRFPASREPEAALDTCQYPHAPFRSAEPMRHEESQA